MTATVTPPADIYTSPNAVRKPPVKSGITVAEAGIVVGQRYSADTHLICYGLQPGDVVEVIDIVAANQPCEHAEATVYWDAIWFRRVGGRLPIRTGAYYFLSSFTRVS